MGSVEDAAIRYVEQGWSVIPMHPMDKTPYVRWKEYQTRLPNEGEIRRWFSLWPNANIALVTGSLSGVVVVDCDNDEVVQFAQQNGLASLYTVKTRRGRHYYFRYPAGATVRNRARLHGMAGLDVRGEGGYAILPPSVFVDTETGEWREYRWESQIDWSDAPVYADTSNTVVRIDGTPWDGEGPLDLAAAAAKHPDEAMSVWQRAQAQALREGGKIQPGNRNELVRDCASEAILSGLFGDALRVKCRAFMYQFFDQVLDEDEFEATVKSMEDAERRNHPERFNEEGEYVYKRVMPKKFRLFQPAQASILKAQIESRGILIDPIIRPGSFTMVYGYTGHGKSLLVQAILWSAAQGMSIGPYEVARPVRTLYLDWENGAQTIVDRSIMFSKMFGDPGDRLSMWAPSIMNEDLNLHEAEHLRMLQDLVELAKPDVVAFDTVRSAWPGLEENLAPAWAPVNRCAMSLRNAGYAVIYLHHANKPTDDGPGREAGSTAQLGNLETQLRVTQLFEDEAIAKAKAGRWDPRTWALARDRLEPDSRVKMIVDVSMGKVRDWTYNHSQSSWFAFCERLTDGTMYVLASLSKKQWAIKQAMKGLGEDDISAKLDVPKHTIKRWLNAG